MLIIAILLILAVLWFAGVFDQGRVSNFFAGRNHRSDGRISALEILKIRYARGEIEKAEFEDRRRGIDA